MNAQVLPFNPETQTIVDSKADATIIFTPTEGGLTAHRDPAAPVPAPKKSAWEEAGFKTAEEMAKSYTELRTKMSQDGAPKGEEKPKTEVPAPETKEETAARQAAEAKVAADKEAVISKTTGEAFAAETKDTTEANAALAWAQANLSPANQKAYNDAIDTGDEKIIKHAVKTLVTTFKQSTKAHEPKLETNMVPVPVVGVEGYADTAQMLKDMNKPEYQTSEAFRASVAAKIKASKNI